MSSPFLRDTLVGFCVLHSIEKPKSRDFLSGNIMVLSVFTNSVIPFRKHGKLCICLQHAPKPIVYSSVNGEATF